MSEEYEYIQTTKDLEAFCSEAHADLLKDDFLTLDTEFIRERTYTPQLCLIQIATRKKAAIIDPLADGMDLQPLLNLLAHPDMLKVLHAGRQDLEIFLALMGELPKNIFDTQIAAMACGFGDSAGYETLVKKITKNALDKSARFSNWAQRPLTPKQLDYAIGDVTYLREIYTHLSTKIKQEGRENWITEEIQLALDPKTYEVNPHRLLFKLKLRTSKPSVLARAFYLVKWREAQAETEDKPRQTIMRDELIIELATQNPQSLEDFRKTRGLRDKNLSRKIGDAIISLLKEASAWPPEECPKLPTPINESSINPLTHDMLRLLLRYVAEKEEVAEKILASSKDIATLIRQGEKADIPCLNGWRYDIFGKTALDLITGKIALSLKDGKLILNRNL